MTSIGVMLKKPLPVALIAILGGLALGLLMGWGIWPVEWSDVPPEKLGVTYQEDYLRMAIDSFAATGNSDTAQARWEALGSNAEAILATIVSHPGYQAPGDIVAFSSLVQTNASETVPAGEETTTPTAGDGLIGSSIFSFVLIVVILLVVGLVIFFIVRFLRPMSRRSGDSTPAQQARELTRQTELTDYAAIGQEPPIAQFVTTFMLGDDLFDDSFSVDSPAGEFMGECGVGISESIGVGEPKKVSAFEVWLFDKNDIQTVTKVIMSAHAYNDVATFQRLESKGEPVLAERHKNVYLETAALQMVATISDMEYGDGALPAQSFFGRVTLELAIWPKTPAP